MVKIVIIYNLTVSGWMTPLLQAYLVYNGHRDTFLIRYRNDLSFENAITDVDEKLETIVNKDNDTIFVIGIFFGGLIANNLHRMDWKIKKALYIGCPMRGTSAHRTIQDSHTVVKYADSDPHNWLLSREPEEIPPHDYHTISLGLWNTEFDGLLRRIDTVIDNENHSHVYWSSRWTPFLTYSLFNLIYGQLHVKNEIDVLDTNISNSNAAFDDYVERYKDL